MFEPSPQLYLASASPRRQALLAQIGIRFKTIEVNTPEMPGEGESPEEFAIRVARDKAIAGCEALGTSTLIPVLGADTVVVVDNQILGKPKNRQDSLTMLERLSGRSHHVLTAVAVRNSHKFKSLVSRSTVTFRASTPAEREAYWATGEPRDKAGGYAIQGLAAIFVAYLEGSYTGVMGLPLYETAQILTEFNVQILRLQA